MSVEITIHSWSKADLPSNWGGHTPVHLQPEETIIKTETELEARKQIIDARWEMAKRERHYHIIQNGRVIFNSAYLHS